MMKSHSMLKRDHEAVIDAWRMIKKYAEIEDAPEFYEGAIGDAAELGVRHGLIGSLLGMAILDLLDCRSRSMKEFGDCGHDNEIYMRRFE